MLAFILRRVRASVVFLAPFSKLQRRFLKAALQVFGSAEDSPRVQAILLVRAMALALPPPAIDACLKGVYRAFSANAKFVNAASAPHINFMASCIVEMYGLDAGAAYQHAFGFIRQLAVLLRQALTSKEKESYREVYCWQTINCLELWANVLAAHADMPELRPLVYPVAQLLLGAARLVPTPAYFPLRLRCVRALNRLAQAAGVFVPVAPLLLEILQWRDLARAPKPAPGDKPPEVLLQLRVGKSAMRSGAYQEEIVEQVMELLAAHLAQWSCHVAFPELAHLPMAQLRRFAKATSVERFRRSARQLADAIERNVAFVGRARDQVDFSPKDLGQVAAFLSAEAAAGSAPVAQHSATLQDRARQRLAMRSAKEVEIGAQLPGSTKVQLDKGRDESDDDMEEPSGDLLPYSKKEKKQQKGDKAGNKKRQRAEEPSDSDTEKEQEMPRGKRGGGKAQKGRQSTAAADALTGGAGDDDWEDREDDVGVYELSDDDDSDGEGAAPVPVAAKGKGKAPPGRKDAKSKTGKGREKSGVNGGGSEKRGKGGKPKEKTGRR